MQDWILWQLLDSALPTGSFVSSNGLEAAIQTKHCTTDNLIPFITLQVENYACTSLPFVTDAWATCNSKSPDNVEEMLSLDYKCEGTLTNHIVRRTSTAQGGALLLLFNNSFQPNTFMKQYKNSVKNTQLGHLPIVFGAMCHSLDIDLLVTQRLFLFLFVRGLLSAAVRLNLIGPYLAQRLLTDLNPIVQRVLDECRDLKSDDAHQCNPLLDIIQASHDSLYSRLFNS
jgi:urease accessory protein